MMTVSGGSSSAARSWYHSYKRQAAPRFTTWCRSGLNNESSSRWYRKPIQYLDLVGIFIYAHIYVSALHMTIMCAQYNAKLHILYQINKHSAIELVTPFSVSLAAPPRPLHCMRIGRLCLRAMAGCTLPGTSKREGRRGGHRCLPPGSILRIGGKLLIYSVKVKCNNS